MSYERKTGNLRAVYIDYKEMLVLGCILQHLPSEGRGTLVE
ncbi:hypothetical protein AB4Z50_13200 [Paenibacillus sp. 2TAB26]